MKKLLIVCFCLSVYLLRAQDFTSTPSQVQDGNYKYIIKFSPVEFVVSKFQLSFERNTGPNSSIQITGSVAYIDRSTKYKEGYGGEFQYRSYVLGRQADNHGALNNLYMAPFINYRYLNMRESVMNDYWYGTYEDVTRDKFNVFGFGLLAGLNTVVAKRFNLDFYLGGGIRISDASQFDENITEEGYKGIAPRFGFDIGINFD